MLTNLVLFAWSGFIVFNSFVVAFFTTASVSLCTSSMLVKFEHTFIVSSNLTRSPSEHLRKNALHPMPEGKGLGLEFMMDKGKEVVLPLDKGKEVVPPLLEVIFAPKLEALPLPVDFINHFRVVPMEFSLKTNTGSSWRVTVKVVDDRVTLDHGWATFAAIHQVRIGYMLTFKLLTPNNMKVIIFNDYGV
ncbi:Speckle-type POZ protein [Hordeum vulgare]|nr:Speckle-type POZ protein [Hordeum vulgare]